MQVYKAYQDAAGDEGTGGFCGTMMQRQNTEAAYQRKVEEILTDENCFRISVVSCTWGPGT